MKWIVPLATLLSLASIQPSFAQTASPTPANAPSSAAAAMEQLEDQKKLIEKETELLDARRKYLEAFRAASGSSSLTRETSGGKTEFASETAPAFETVALSYEAVREISARIDDQLKGVIGGYDRIVLHSEKDFGALPRYRLYREQTRQALANYDALIKQLSEEAARADDKAVNVQSGDRSPGEAIISALSMPSIATGAVRSVADLISLFRTDRTITQAVGTVDEKSLDTVLAGTFMRAHPNLRIYNPDQFVPEYDVGIGDTRSFYEDLVKVNAAEAYVDYLLAELSKPAVEKQMTAPVARAIAGVRIVKNQLHGLTFALRPAASAAEAPDVGEFRQMVRAEKLDRFLRPNGVSNAKAGIMMIRLLRSGGSRRESRNLILGSKTDYSGSAFVEIAVYDVDGTMRASEVFSYHTGFRKFPTGK